MWTIKVNKKKWLLIILLLVALGIGTCKLVNNMSERQVQTITFKNCTENYYYSTKWPDMEGEEDYAARGRLAVCLCQSYSEKADTAIARKIMEIYNNDGRHILFNTSQDKNYNKLDSVIKYRKMVFDTVAQYD
ncbi:hypothetical protein [Mucilaginibacter celer]|uniref:Uncharacterized protein n=1 Tax=Mucilaginibacter celer TaxID=2305508 RepID=A0A494VID6_9SPHI|nr:hypothetical protein [Mucilaginibacter celer]AYL94587.1 hypothetical protein HYN43_004420 [Mucilaginibacter celer]